MRSDRRTMTVDDCLRARAATPILARPSAPDPQRVVLSRQLPVLGGAARVLLLLRALSDAPRAHRHRQLFPALVAGDKYGATVGTVRAPGSARDRHRPAAQ